MTLHPQSIAATAAGATPNEGYSLDAPEAMEMAGWDRLAIDDWKQREQIDESKQIRLLRLSHMRYQHPDLNIITQFLLDFGMHIAKKTDDKIWFRGYSSEPYVYVAEKGAEKKFLGGAWTVESYADLEKYVGLSNYPPRTYRFVRGQRLSSHNGNPPPPISKLTPQPQSHFSPRRHPNRTPN